VHDDRPAFASAFRWAGAILFFASLAYFLFTYVTTFGVAAVDAASAPAITWNVALFTIFALHHSVFARTGIRHWVARTFPDLERSIYVWVASILFILVCALWRPVPGVVWHVTGAAAWVMTGLQVGGVWLTLRSARALDVRDLAGIGSTHARPTEFKTTGPYGWVRHPIYAGWFLMVLPTPVMTMTRLVFALVSCAYLLIAIPLEERTMRSSQDGGYEGYMRKVRWRLVPGLY
jgi:protein-S-isoprenylcysteine O-methyltransferase Ste14